MCVSTEERSRGDDYKSTTLFPSAREVSCNKIPASLRGKKEKSSACFSAEYQDSSKSPRVKMLSILELGFWGLFRISRKKISRRSWLFKNFAKVDRRGEQKAINDVDG